MTLDYHEPPGELPQETRDLHRAISSLVEELEAVDWYQMRLDATSDANLRGILLHNRNEELEHAAMLIEWLRRRLPEFDENLKTYLNTTAPIAEVEEVAMGRTADGTEDAPASEPDSLGIGRLS